MQAQGNVNSYAQAIAKAIAIGGPSVANAFGAAFAKAGSQGGGSSQALAQATSTAVSSGNANSFAQAYSAAAAQGGCGSISNALASECLAQASWLLMSSECGVVVRASPCVVRKVRMDL